MPNEVIIRVKAVNDTKPVYDAIRAESKMLGDDIAVTINKTVTQRLKQEAQASAGGAYAGIGDTIGDTIGRRVSERISERIKVDVNQRVRDSVRDNGDGRGDRDRVHVDVDVDIDKQTLAQRLAGIGNSIKDKVSGFFSSGALTGITSVFSGDAISTILKGGLIGLAGSVLAPAIGAAISSGILLSLGGGAIGIGIAGALKDTRIHTAINAIKEELGFNIGKTPKERAAEPIHGLFKDFSENFRGPLENFLAPGNKGGGGLIGVIKQIEPIISQLGKNLGPIADQLGNGIIGFLQNALPGILRAMDAANPLIQTLADKLPGIGEHIGKFFDKISESGPEANQFFSDLLGGINFTIDVLGSLILAFSRMYIGARKATLLVAAAFGEMAGWILDAADAALGWIPGWGPKLDAAKRKVEDFKKGVNKQLDGIKDADIYARIHVWGIGAARALLDVTQQLQAMGVVKKASGGVTPGHAATGGSRSGLTWVGERGPELIDAAPGSRVYSNADSMRMAGQGGAGWGGRIEVPVYLDGHMIARAMADPMRDLVRNQHGGDVQAAYGV